MSYVESDNYLDSTDGVIDNFVAVTPIPSTTSIFPSQME